MSKYKEAEQRLGRGDKIKSTSVRSLTKSSVKQWNSGQNRVSCKNGSQGGGRCFSPLFISASFISTLTFVGNNSHFYCSRATALDLLGRENSWWSDSFVGKNLQGRVFAFLVRSRKKAFAWTISDQVFFQPITSQENFHYRIARSRVLRLDSCQDIIVYL